MSFGIQERSVVHPLHRWSGQTVSVPDIPAILPFVNPGVPQYLFSAQSNTGDSPYQLNSCLNLTLPLLREGHLANDVYGDTPVEIDCLEPGRGSGSYVHVPADGHVL